MAEALALLTVIVLVGYLVAVLDDVVFDLIHLVRFRGRAPKGSLVERIRNAPPKRLAVMIPAWQEAGVVAEMVDATIDLADYPKDRIDFFIGVYPNDTASLRDAQRIAARHPNVHAVVNERAGPTKKAQNLNFVYRAIEEYERIRGVEFDGVAVHDAEDVVHPYAFRVYGCLLEEHAVVQLPVFALLPERGFWKRLVAGTYADEFAEAHMCQVPTREALGMFVPSAGTGFAVRRSVLRELAAEGPLFHEEALAEDYEFALRLWSRGHRVHFHLQEVRRVDDRGRSVREYVGVQEHFPQEAAASVRQKGRWIYGIAMQARRLAASRTRRRPTLLDRFAFWRDEKGRYTNLVHLLGYPLAAYALLALPLDLPYGDHPWIAPLAVVVALLTLERLSMRALLVGRLYGFRQALWASFVPPFVPLRWIVANLLNLRATLRAWRLYLFPGAGARRGRAPAWDKTMRKGYVADEVLRAARRRLGDQLIFYGHASPEAVAELVRRQRERPDDVPLGELAVAEHLVPDTAIADHLIPGDAADRPAQDGEAGTPRRSASPEAPSRPTASESPPPRATPEAPPPTSAEPPPLPPSPAAAPSTAEAPTDPGWRIP